MGRQFILDWISLGGRLHVYGVLLDSFFPLNAVYGTQLFTLVGGGIMVFNALVMSTIAAAAPEESSSVLIIVYGT